MRPRLIALALGVALLPAVALTQSAPAPTPACDTGLAQINPIFGWQLQRAQALRTLAAAPATQQAAALAEWRALATEVRADIAGLRQGLAEGRIAPAPVIDRVLSQVRALDDQLAASPLATDPAWRALLDRDLRPALAAYIDFLERDYRPKAPRASSFAGRPEARTCFGEAVTQWTTLTLPPEEIEASGHRLLAEARADLAKAAGVSEADLPTLLAELRRGTPGATREELLKVTEGALSRGRAATPRFFHLDKPLPPIVVEPFAPALEADAVAGVYRPATDSAPAAYVVNLSRPEERRLMAEVIAFHETFPGHHLAFAAQRSAGSFNSGFIEGWAIYAEYLADEAGLYATPRDRLGLHAKHMWAASRLIVEPGLHVRGWTRAQAIDFMRANTLLSDTEIAVEVDRYLALPGQSLSYMLGADRLRKARARAERVLGKAFDIRRFHKMVLDAGPRPLDAVDADVDRWIGAMAKPRT
ncbi:DUF885 domain-containing protein [Sphingoaurantiacus capsulatus]|uniref:DUF885 domain-containing protein n=1 Tax=Sphingoaurantiacus capsulatus TaxID=1771310 RepID=A0ABV7X8R8_9SPHN